MKIQDWTHISAWGLFPSRTLDDGTRLPYEKEVETAKKWIALHVKPRKTLNMSYNSYRLKHLVERWGDKNGLEPYVSNGALILAMQQSGYSPEREGYAGEGCPNALFRASCINSDKTLIPKG